jgi:putative glutathione S-transferase
MATKTGTSLDDISTKGEFQRKAAQFRSWIKADGSTEFKPEANRYHLFISLACPWACRTYIVRKLKGLEDVISLSVVNWLLDDNGWSFRKEGKDEFGVDTTNPLNDFPRIKDFYLSANSNYDGRFTIPVLWDKTLKTIVSNESSEIIRMLNSEFNAFAKNPSLDLYPANLRADIDKVNDEIYDNINNGVYKCGFATSQEAYEKSFHALFQALDKYEGALTKSRYLVGNTLTEADVRFFTTLVRFDPVYVGHFKCNQKQIREYPALYGYLRDLYHTQGISETVDFNHIKYHYYGSHKKINPTSIVPLGPIIDLTPAEERKNL